MTLKRRIFGLFRTVHAWSGAVLSAILAVLGLSGSLLVLKDDWLRLRHGEAATGFEPTPDRLAAIAEGAERQFGESVRTAVFGDPHLGLTKLYLDEGGFAWLDRNGETVTAWQGTAQIEEWVFDLHHHLLAGHVGETVAGIAGLCGVLLVITGLVAVWPARRALSWRIWPNSAHRGVLLATHRNLGLIMAAPLVLSILTGSAMVFSAQAYQALSVFNEKPEPAPVTAPVTAAGPVDWQTGFAAAQALWPDAAIRIASWPAAADQPARLRLRQREEWHSNGRTVVLLDPVTGTATASVDAQALPRGRRANHAVYPLHSARLGHGPAARLYDLVVVLTGLALTALGGLGLFAFLRHRLPARR